MNRVPLFILILLGAAATFCDVATAEEEDPRCQVQMCYAGPDSSSQCRTSLESGGDCNGRCNELGCDGGSQVGDPFGCPVGNPFILCQCNSCGSSGGDPDTGGGSGPGDGGGGSGCSDCLCSDEVCDDNCWWDGWEWGECYLNECWCHSDLD